MADDTIPVEDVPQFKNIGEAVSYQYESLYGTKNREKYKTDEQKNDLAEKYIKHCREGLSDDCFVECDKRTFVYYVTTYPTLMRLEELISAQLERRRFWERMGTLGASGKLKGFNAKAWEFNMMNRYRKEWKLRQDVTSDDAKVQGGYIVVPEKKPEGYGAIPRDEDE